MTRVHYPNSYSVLGEYASEMGISVFFVQAEEVIRVSSLSRGLGDVYKGLLGIKP